MASPDKAPSEAAVSGPVAGAASASLTIHVENMRNAKGLMHFCLTDIEKDYTDCEEHEGSVQMEMSAEQAVTVEVPELAPGTYYLLVLHDENANGKLDKFLGIPKEGFGFSGNPGLRAGPPRAHHVRFDVTSGASEQRIKLRYLL